VKSIDVNKTPLGISAGAIGYYLAGLFALNIAIVNFQILNWLLFIVGVILSLYGLILLLDPVLDLSDRIKIPNTVRMYLIIGLLSVCGGQLIIAVTYGTLFRILSLIFIASFAFVVVYKSLPVFQNKGQLLTLFITLLILGLIQFFFVDSSLRWDRWDLYFILLVDLIILGRLLKVVLKSNNTRATSVSNLKEPL